MSVLVIDPAIHSEFEYGGHNVSIVDNAIGLRKRATDYKYSMHGTYYQDSFKTTPRRLDILESIYSIELDNSNCEVYLRISTNGGDVWDYYDSGWESIGCTFTPPNLFTGDVQFHVDPCSDGTIKGWMSLDTFNANISSLQFRGKLLSLWLYMVPTGIDRPCVKGIYVNLNHDGYSVMEDAQRSLVDFFENNLWFKDYVRIEFVNEMEYTIPGFVPVTPEYYVGEIINYVRAYHIPTDPLMAIDIVDTWDSTGKVLLDNLYSGEVYIKFGHRPPVHIMTDPILQDSDSLALLLNNFTLTEDSSFDPTTEYNLSTMTGRRYLQRWADIGFTAIIQSNRTDQVARMATALRKLLHSNIVYLINSGNAFKLTSMGGTGNISRVNDQISILQIPLSFGTYRIINEPLEGELVGTINVDYTKVGR